MFKKNKEIKEQAQNYQILRGETNGLVKNVVRLSRHENDLVEFDTYALIPAEVVGASVRVCDQQICNRVFLPFTVH